jgi:aminoglycoside/choline kinase family phosphotransferase
MSEVKAKDVRIEQMRHWLTSVLGHNDYQLEIASGDASFRRYFRLRTGDDSRIVMDAPPDKEDCKPFVEISAALLKLGLHMPEVLQQDLQQGFLLLTDLGQQQYLQVLDESNVERLYDDALGALATLQAGAEACYDFPPYDDALLMTEMYLFRDWLLDRHLGIDLQPQDRDMLEQVFSLLSASAREQPQVPVHRDYHSRNLMVTMENNPGILDFQDAVMGPVTYDLVSLLRDCYIAWPRQQVEAWVRDYHELALQSGILREKNEAEFLRWFDLMGVQRHLKAAGIFARLYHRDQKPAYLQDIPRTVNYIIEVSSRYPELQDLHRFLSAIDGWVNPQGTSG